MLYQAPAGEAVKGVFELVLIRKVPVGSTVLRKGLPAEQLKKTVYIALPVGKAMQNKGSKSRVVLGLRFIV